MTTPIGEEDDFIRTYVDALTLVIELAPSPDGPPAEVFETQLDPEIWKSAEVVDALEVLVSDPALTAASGFSDSGDAVPFCLDTKRSVMSWGADGVGETVLLRLAEWTASGIAGNAAYAALKHLLRALRTTNSFGTGAMTADEARSLAHWGVSRRFGLPDPIEWKEVDGAIEEVVSPEWTLLDESQADGGWSFRWRGPDAHYEVDVEYAEGYATLTRYRRVVKD